jgi:transcriptional regulator with XRE-family HTH domain
MTNLPVKGDVLQWARTFRGLNEQQAADLLGMTVAELRQYEAEKVPITIGVFENFAAKYRLPQATLFRLTRPREPAPPKDFRTIEGRKHRRDGFEFNIALSNVRTLLHHYDRIISDDDEFAAPDLPALALNEPPEIAGERERRRRRSS